MKRLLFCCCLATMVWGAEAQTPIPEYGSLTTTEKNMTTCEFDKEADAVILFDKAIADHNDENNLITTRRVRVKILKEKGIDRGDIQLYYYSKDDFEVLREIQAAVYNVDANGNVQTRELASSAIFRQKINDRVSVAKFALPNLKVGSIFEYEYTSVMKHYGGLEDWYFQADIPTLLSSYSIVIIPNFEFAYQVHKSEELPITIKPDKSSGKVLFEMQQVAGLRDEPFMDAPRDYRQRIEFQLSGYSGRFGDRTRYMTTWDELTRELMSHFDFGALLTKNINGAADLVIQAKSKPRPYETMTTIYQYLQRSVNWDGYTTRFAPEGIKEVWEKKKGSSGAINLLLINLLKEAGLEVYPLLVSERDHGKVRADYPFLDQFNNVMAYVLIDNKTYVLDAAGSYTPPDLIPFSIVNTKGFVVNRKKGGIISLEEKKRMNKNRVIIDASVDAEGQLTGEALIISHDYARINRERVLRQSEEKWRGEYIARYHPEMKTDSLRVKNLQQDSLPLEQRLHFQLPANSNGDYKLINLNLFSGFQQNPFISDIRFTNVDYGCLQQLELVEMIDIAGNLEPESLPKDLRLIMPDTSISFGRYLYYGDHKLTARYKIEISRSVFTADEYPLLKEFYKKMIDILNEQVVFRKK